MIRGRKVGAVEDAFVAVMRTLCWNKNELMKLGCNWLPDLPLRYKHDQLYLP